jgi:hypothetical protein
VFLSFRRTFPDHNVAGAAVAATSAAKDGAGLRLPVELFVGTAT